VSPNCHQNWRKTGKNGENREKPTSQLNDGWQRDLAEFSMIWANGEIAFQDRRFQPLTHSSAVSRLE
jgi:hypothetical protein